MEGADELKNMTLQTHSHNSPTGELFHRVLLNAELVLRASLETQMVDLRLCVTPD